MELTNPVSRKSEDADCFFYSKEHHDEAVKKNSFLAYTDFLLVRILFCDIRCIQVKYTQWQGISLGIVVNPKRISLVS